MVCVQGAVDLSPLAWTGLLEQSCVHWAAIMLK